MRTKHKLPREVFKVQKGEKLHRINNLSSVNPSNPSIWFTQYRNKFIENRIIGNFFVIIFFSQKSAFNLWGSRGCLHSCPYVTEVSRFDPFMSNTLSLCCMNINEVQNLLRIFIIGFFNLFGHASPTNRHLKNEKMRKKGEIQYQMHLLPQCLLDKDKSLLKMKVVDIHPMKQRLTLSFSFSLWCLRT